MTFVCLVKLRQLTHTGYLICVKRLIKETKLASDSVDRESDIVIRSVRTGDLRGCQDLLRMA